MFKFAKVPIKVHEEIIKHTAYMNGVIIGMLIDKNSITQEFYRKNLEEANENLIKELDKYIEEIEYETV